MTSVVVLLGVIGSKQWPGLFVSLVCGELAAARAVCAESARERMCIIMTVVMLILLKLIYFIEPASL